MILADIKGKLSLSELYSEDFLTSAVFSAFMYLDEKWISKYLNKAINIRGDNLCVELNNPKYDFWAYFGAINETGWGTEPDVIIYFDKTAIIIEAKNYSGKSGEGVLHEGKSDDSEIIDIKKIADQLRREYFVGRKSIQGLSKVIDEDVFDVDNFLLIFLTRHPSFPKDEIGTTINAIADINPSEKENAEQKIYWLNWQKAMPIFEEITETESKSTAEHKISKDMIVFLERRNLGIFSGFDFLDNCIESRKEAKDLLNEENIFYKKLFKPYWVFLGKIKPYQRNEQDALFYKSISSPYWNYIKNGFEFISDPVFYTISYKPYWEKISPFIDFQIKDEIFYRG